MARKSNIARDKKRKRMVVKFAEKRSVHKAEGNLDALVEMPRNGSPVRLKNRCFKCGRPRGFMRQFALCRICFRELANEGKIPGVRKSSW